MIAQMDSLEIVCLRETLPELLEMLQQLGVLHIEEMTLSVEGYPDFLHRPHLNEAAQTELETLNELRRMLDEILPLLTVSPGEDRIKAAAEAVALRGWAVWRRSARSISRELRSLTRRRVNSQDNLEVLAEQARMLEVLKPALCGRDAVLGANARAFVLEDDAPLTVEQLGERLREEAGTECGLVAKKAGGGAHACAVLYPEPLDKRVSDFLHEYRIAPVDVGGAAARQVPFDDALEELRQHIAEQRVSLDQLSQKLTELSKEHGAEVMAMRAIVADRIELLNALHFCAWSELTGVVHGWAPAKTTPVLKAALEKRFGGRVAVRNLPVHTSQHENVPTLLENPGVFRPFEVLMTFFRPPVYGAMDPSALVGVFFVLFYGFILGDVAYGLAVIAFSCLLRYLWGHNRIVRSASVVGIYAGVSAMVFGFLFGEFLGDVGEKWLHLPALWFHRGHDPIRLLLAAVAIGVGHVIFSLVLGLREDMRHRETAHFQEKLALLSGLLGAGVAVLAFAGMKPFNTAPMIAVAVALGVACVVLLIRAVGAMAAVQVMEVVSLITNILSYSRLMALGIASVALAEVANDFAREAGTPWLGIPAALAIHLLNICLGIFSPALHSLRLNYVESLPKFFSPQGKPYKPFKKEALS